MSEWESEEYVEKHLDSAHVQEAFFEGGRLLTSPPDIRRYQSNGLELIYKVILKLCGMRDLINAPY